MIPFQGVCNLYFATVNLQFGLHITSEKKTRKLGLLKTSGNETKTFSHSYDGCALVLCMTEIKLHTPYVS